MSTAWFCPACQKHHAPHVETCPLGVYSAKPFPGYERRPGTIPSQACGCASEECRRNGCQAQRQYGEAVGRPSFYSERQWLS